MAQRYLCLPRTDNKGPPLARLSYAAQAAFLPELFPARVRYSGVAISREVPGALLGGTAPLIATALFAATGQWWPIAIFMVATALVTIVALHHYQQ